MLPVLIFSFFLKVFQFAVDVRSMQFVFFLGVDALSRERLLRTIFFYSGHLQHECERSDMERNYVTNNKAQQ